MKNLTTAIYTHFTALDGGAHNAFWTDLQGQLYKGRAPEGTEFPYAVFSLAGESHMKTFDSHFKNPLIQFSLFSSESSTSEIEDMFTDCNALYDEAELTITDNTHIWMRIQNDELIPDIITTRQWTREIWHYVIDYDVMVQYTP